MKLTANIFTKPRAFFVLVGFGIAIAALIKLTRPAMEHQEQTVQGTPAGFIELEEYSVRPEITGYGAVQPDLSIDIRTEVSGRIINQNPDLKEGETLAAGTTVVKIDDKDYRLALAKAEAGLAQSRINLSDRQRQKTNIEADLKLAEEKLALARKDLKRTRSLFKKGSLSESTYESKRTSVLQLQQEVQKLITQKDSQPYLVEVQQAQVAIAEADVEARRRDLERTVITIPEEFAARVTKVNIEAGEFVASGTSLFSIQGLNRVKINTQITVESFSKLLSGHDDLSLSLEQVLQGEADTSQKLFNKLGLSAYVRMAGTDSPVWPARVARVDSNLDPASRTVGVIVTVDHPYQDIRPGVKPPLMEGMYMEVVLQGAARPYLVIPRSAIHEKQIYRLSAKNTLERHAVKGITQGEMILVKPDVFSDRQIISSDLFPAINGMQLAPYPDTGTRQAITHWLEER